MLFGNTTSTLGTLSIGANGKVLKISSGTLTWGDDLGGVTYQASEQGIHLNTSTNIFSLVLNGNSLSQSSNGLAISPSYVGQASITTLGTITSGTWSGTTIAPNYGGTGISTAPSAGQLLIGNGTGYTLGNIIATATSGIKLVNGTGSINLSFDFSLLNSITSASGDNDFVMVYNGATGSNKKISYNDLFRDFQGALKYQGTWNASTNVPDINSAPTTSGFFYIVQTAGTSTVNGISSWSVGDWVVYSSTGWEKVQSTNQVNSVFGRVGSIVAEYGDYSADKITTATSSKLSATNVQAAINEIVNKMEGTIATSTTGTYFRGDKNWATLDTAAVVENAGFLYFTNDRARSAFSVASDQGMTFDTSTGIFALNANRSLPFKGSTLGEMLVWDSNNWVPTTSLSNYIFGLGVSNFATNTISQWKNDANYLKLSSTTGSNLFYDGSILSVTTTPSFTSLSVLNNGLYLASSTPASTTYSLYNLGGKLYFNGAAVNSSATIDSGTSTGQIAYWNGSGWVASPSVNLNNGVLSIIGTVSSTNILNTGTVTSTNGWFSNLLTALSAYFTNLIADNATTTNLVATNVNIGNSTSTNINVTNLTTLKDLVTSGNAAFNTTTATDLTSSLLTVANTSTLNIILGNGLNISGLTNLATTTISNLTVNNGLLTNNGVLFTDFLPTVTSSKLYNVGGKLFWNGKQLAETTTGTINTGNTIGDMLYWDGTVWNPTSLLNLNASGKQFTIGSSTNSGALHVYGTSTFSGLTSLNTTTINYLSVLGNSSFNTITSGTWNGNMIGIGYGGTGITSTPGFNKLLMGDGTSYIFGAITATSGLTISNSTGTIEVALNIPTLKLSNTMNGEDQFVFYSSSTNSNKRVAYNDVFGSVLGSLNYRGTWDPITNSPSLSASSCTSTSKGYYYVASTSTTSSVAISGLGTWNTNDWLVCNGSAWERIQTTNAVTSVFGRTGAVTAQAGDYNALKIDFTPTSSVSSTNVQDAIKELAERSGAAGGSLGDILSWNGTKWVSTSTISLGSNGNIYFTGNLLPSTAGAFDIGSETNYVRDLYISSSSLKIAGQSLSNNNGILNWGGSALNVGGFSVAGNNSTSTGSMAVGGALTVAGQSAFAGDITVNGSMLLTGTITSSQITATTGTFTNLVMINPATFANLNWTNATGTNLNITGLTNLATTTATNLTGSGLTITNTSTLNNLVVSGLANLATTSMLGLTVTNNGIYLSSSTPTFTTNTLYALGSNLYWNGSKVGSSGGLNWATSTISSTSSLFGLTPNNTTSTGIGTDGSNMWLGTNSTARVYIAQDGTVGINATTTPYNLTVGGSIGTYTAGTISNLVGSIGVGASPTDIEISGRYAYTVNSAGANNFSIVDTTNLTNMIVQGQTTAGGASLDMAISGNYAFITNNTATANNSANTVTVVDISNPVSPIAVASTTIDSPYGIAISGKYAYVTSNALGTLSVLDISNPLAPVVVASTTVGTSPRYLAISGKYAYVANYGSNNVSTVDISNPLAPTVVYTAGTDNTPYDIAISGRYAYVTCYSSGNVYVLDLQFPHEPGGVAAYIVSANPRRVAVAGHYVYVTHYGSNNMSVVDIDSEVTKKVANVYVGTNAFGIAIVGHYAYVGASNSLMISNFGGATFNGLSAGSIESSALRITGNLAAYGKATIGDSLSVGNGGIMTSGGLSVVSGGVFISSSTPTITTNTLYALGSDLYWNGSKVGSGGGLNWTTSTINSTSSLFGLTPNNTTSTGIGTDGLNLWLGTSSTARVYLAQDGSVMVGTTTIANSPTKTGTTTPSFMTINGKTTIFGDLVVYGNIIPGLTDTYSIGSTSTQWKDLAVSSSTMYIGGVPLSNNSGSLTWNNTTLGGNIGTTNQSLTYGEAINAGDLVQINSSGSAIKISTTTAGASTSISSIGSQQVGGTFSGATANVGITYLSDNKFVIVYPSVSGLILYARVGQYNGDVITWGSEVALMTALNAPVGAYGITSINGGNGFVVNTYHNNTENNNALIAASVSGLIISNVVINKPGDATNSQCLVTEVSTNRLATTCLVGTTLYTWIKTVNGDNTITSVGNGYQTGWATNGDGVLSMTKVSNNKVVIVTLNSSNNLVAIVADVSGTSPTFGTAVVMNASTWTKTAVVSYAPDKFVAIGRNTGTGYVYVYSGTISGTAITAKSNAGGNISTAASGIYVSAASPNTNNIVVGLENGTSGMRMVSMSVTSGTEAIATTSEFTIGTANNNHYNNIWLSYLAPGRLVTVFLDYNNSSYPTVQTINMGSSTVVSQGSLAGIAQTSGTAGTVGTVAMLGGVSTVHSTLTPGALYYIQSNGTLGTTNTGYVVGRAVSTTTLSLSDMYNSGVTSAGTNSALLISSPSGASKVTTQYAGADNDALRFFTNNIQRMVVEGNGVVSFYGNGLSIQPGTPSTTAYGLYSDGTGKLYWNGSVVASQAWAANWATTTLGTVGLAPTSTSGVGLGSDGKNFWLSTNSALRFFIASSTGYVGIGTATTTNMLTVQGAISLASSTLATTTNSLYAIGSNLYWNGNSIGGLNWATTTVSTGTIFGLTPNSSTSTGIGTDGINLWLGAGNNSVVFITPSGTVSMGTTTIGSNTLTVQGGITLTSSTPATTTNALYALNNKLYWNGSSLGGLNWATSTINSTSSLFGLTPNSSTSTGIGTDGLNLWLGTSSTARVYLAQDGSVMVGTTTIANSPTKTGSTTPSFMTINGKTTIFGDLVVYGNIIPGLTDTYSIGSTSTQWKDLAVSSSTMYIGGVPLSNNSGSLTWNNTAVNNNTDSSGNLTQQLVYASTMTTGTLVQINSLGQATRLTTSTSGSSSTIASVGSPNIVDTATGDLPGKAIAYLSDNKFVVVYSDSANTTMYGRVGIYSGDTVNWGAITTLATFATAPLNMTMSITSINGGAGFAVLTQSKSGYNQATIASVSGTNISSIVQSSTNNSGNPGVLVEASTNRLVEVFLASGSGTLYGFVYTVNAGNTITQYGSTLSVASFGSTSLGTTSTIAAVKVNTNKVVGFAVDASGYVSAAAFDTSAMSVGSKTVVSNLVVTKVSAASYTTDKAAVLFKMTTGNEWRLVANSISGTTITVGGALTVSSTSSGLYASMVSPSDGYLMAAVESGASGPIGLYSIYCGTGTACTLPASSNNSNASNYHYNNSWLSYLSPGRIAMIYPAAGSSNNPTVQAITMGASTVVNQGGFAGITQTSANAGSVGTVAMLGGVSTVHTGLTPGSLYYIQTNGTLGTGSTNYLVGRAVSSTAISMGAPYGAASVTVSNNSSVPGISSSDGAMSITTQFAGASSDALRFYTNNSPRMVIDNTGVVNFYANGIVINPSATTPSSSYALYSTTDGKLYWNGSLIGSPSWAANWTTTTLGNVGLAPTSTYGVGLGSDGKSFWVSTSNTLKFFIASSTNQISIGGSTLATSSVLTVSGTSTILGDLVVSGGLYTLFSSIDFTTTTAYVNDVNFGTNMNVRINATSSNFIGITGIAGGSNGRQLTLVNASSTAQFIIYNQSASSTATNRIITGTGSDLTVAADATILLAYDSIAQRWRIVGGTGGSSQTKVYTVNSSSTLANTSFGSTQKIDATASTVVVTLPTAANNTGKSIEFIKTDMTSNVGLILPYGSETVAGATSLGLYNTGDAVTLRSDGANWQIVSDNRSSIGTGVSYYQAFASAIQSSVGAGTVVAFSAASSTYNGTDITFNSASNTFRLKAGKTYRLTGTGGYWSGTYVAYNWKNETSGSYLGTGGGIEGSTDDTANAVFTPAVDTVVDLVVTLANASANFGYVSGNSIRLPSAYIEVISQPAAVINTVDYIFAKAASNQSISGANVDLAFSTTVSGNIPNSSGVFTLQAGKTYSLTSDIALAASGQFFQYQWVDASTNTALPGGTLGFALAVDVTGPVPSTANRASLTYTPTTTQQVKLRTTGVATASTLLSTASFVSITQIGSTGYTGLPFNYLGGAMTNGALDNTNFAQTWDWSTLTTSTALALSANALTTGSLLTLSTNSATVSSTNGLLYVVNSGTATSGLLASFVASTTAKTGLFIKNNGYVGIGTSTPSSALTVVGGGDILNSGGAQLYIRDTNTAGGAFKFVGYNGATYIESGTSTASGSTAPLYFTSMNAADTWMTIATSGYVGIGTSTPDAPLSVYATTGAVGIKLADFYSSEGGLLHIYDSVASGFLPTIKGRSNGADGYGVALYGAIPSDNDVFASAGAAVLIRGMRSDNTVLQNANVFSVNNYTTNLLTIKANGNVGINSTTPNYVLSVGNAYVTAGGAWTNGSDRNSKENFVAVDSKDILNKIVALPMTQWNYKNEATTTMHIGPMAQDFYATFGLGGSDTSISTIDPAGIALVGIQGLSMNLSASESLTNLNLLATFGTTTLNSLDLTNSSTIFATDTLAIDNEVSSTISGISATSSVILSESEGSKLINVTSTVDYIKSKLASGYSYLHEFVAVRVTAVTGWFNDVWTNRVHTKELCVGENGNETCITKDQLDKMLNTNVNANNTNGPSTPTTNPNDGIIVHTDNVITTDPTTTSANITESSGSTTTESTTSDSETTTPEESTTDNTTQTNPETTTETTPAPVVTETPVSSDGTTI